MSPENSKFVRYTAPAPVDNSLIAVEQPKRPSLVDSARATQRIYPTLESHKSTNTAKALQNPTSSQKKSTIQKS